MGVRPDGFTLDRIDGNRGYEPANCRWADLRTQNSNKSTCVRVEFSNRIVTIAEASSLSGIPLKTLYARAQAGKSGDALFHKRSARQ
jgi:hypothetical protein